MGILGELPGLEMVKPRKFNVAPEKGLFLKESFPVGISIFSGTMLKFQGGCGILLKWFLFVEICVTMHTGMTVMLQV